MTCVNQFTEESETYIHPPELNDVPPYLCPVDTVSDYSDIGSRIMEEMLLTQYSNSTNLKEYISAFVLEMDLLLEEIKKVELGRYISNAVGAQLDVIGVILQQTRNLDIPIQWFGFQGAPNVAGMADEAVPSNGGIFRGADQEGFEITPLDDARYRNVLLCRAYCLNQGVFDIDTIYEAISILLGQTPNHMRIYETQFKIYTLEMDSLTVTGEQAQLILAVKHWFIPMSVGFTVSLVNGLFDVQHNTVDITHNAVNVTHTS